MLALSMRLLTQPHSAFTPPALKIMEDGLVHRVCQSPGLNLAWGPAPTSAGRAFTPPALYKTEAGQGGRPDLQGSALGVLPRHMLAVHAAALNTNMAWTRCDRGAVAAAMQ